MVKKEYTVISTFAGCGGSSLGYKIAGFRELLAIEWEDNAVETFKLNFSEVPVWQKDITTVTADEILNFCKIKVGELDIFDGSPPCQGFSTAGKREVTDERNDLFRHYVRLIDGLQPKVFVMENVSGMIKGKMKGKFIEIMTTLKALNYNVKCKLMNSMYYEVPQSRERVIFIGVRKDLNIIPSYPPPSAKIITFGMIMETGLGSNLDEDDLLRWKHIPWGGNFSDLPIYLLNTKAKFSNCFRKLHPNKPCYTVGKEEHFSSGRFFHPIEPRRISDTELKRVSTFPDDYIFAGNSKNIHNRIGNAVPPKLMFHIAKNIKENILDKYYKKE